MTDRAGPMVEAMDAFDRFWNATVDVDEDWTVVGLDCECENCRFCGIRWALHWTHALLSNPSLVETAERTRAKRVSSVPLDSG